MFCCFSRPRYRHYSFECDFCLKYHIVIQNENDIYIEKYKKGTLVKTTLCDNYEEGLTRCYECIKILKIVNN
jgi:hypothetical protein